MLVSQLNNYTLAPISEERSAGAARVNPPWSGDALVGVAGPSVGLVVRRVHQHGRVEHGAPPAEQQQVAAALEDDAEVEQHPTRAATGRSAPATKAEIIRINTEARPLALQIACSSILAGLIGPFDRSG